MFDPGTLNQVNEAFSTQFVTFFEDNNLVIEYDPNAAPIAQDSQFAWMTEDLWTIIEQLENGDELLAAFVLEQAAAFVETVIAQVVLPEGCTATIYGTIVAEDGTELIVEPVVIGPEA